MEGKDSTHSQLKARTLYKQTKLCFFGGKITISEGSCHKNSNDKDVQKSNSLLNHIIDCATVTSCRTRKEVCQEELSENEQSAAKTVEHILSDHNRNSTLLGCYDQNELVGKLTSAYMEKNIKEIQKVSPFTRISLKRPKNKQFKRISGNQMLLDAGQKKFGITHCSGCKFVYHLGDPGDETIHRNYHDAQHILKFSGWKNERVVFKYEHGRIIHVIPGDPIAWRKKIELLSDFINRDFGYFDIILKNENIQVFLFIKNRMIVGCLVAEAASEGRKMLIDNSGIDFCSEETYPIKCGILRIWVSQTYRRQKIGTILLDCLKKCFHPNNVLTNLDVAFSSPTDLGKSFAVNYFGTSNFLVYGV